MTELAVKSEASKQRIKKQLFNEEKKKAIQIAIEQFATHTTATILQLK
jgi:hypothetical protein